eukprot:RCo041938
MVCLGPLNGTLLHADLVAMNVSASGGPVLPVALSLRWYPHIGVTSKVKGKQIQGGNQCVLPFVILSVCTLFQCPGLFHFVRLLCGCWGTFSPTWTLAQGARSNRVGGALSEFKKKK